MKTPLNFLFHSHMLTYRMNTHTLLINTMQSMNTYIIFRYKKHALKAGKNVS